MESITQAAAHLTFPPSCCRCETSPHDLVQIIFALPGGNDWVLSACGEHAADVAVGPELAHVLREVTR